MQKINLKFCLTQLQQSIGRNPQCDRQFTQILGVNLLLRVETMTGQPGHYKTTKSDKCCVGDKTVGLFLKWTENGSFNWRSIIRFPSY